MSERFFSDEPITGDSARLTDQEAHHLLHVMRLKEGARVTLFDGSGAEFDAEVQQCGRRDVVLAVLSRREVDRELPAPLVIAAALPKGDRQRWMVEKLTELGVTRLVPLETERSVVKPSAGALDKLRRAVIEASKQCRRNRLMEIAASVTLADLLANDSLPSRRLIAHPVDVATSIEQSCEPTTVAVGPEGGFSDDEVAAARSTGWSVVGLGPRVLRTETAAVALAVECVPAN